MGAGLCRQTFNLIEIDNQKLGEMCQGKRIERLTFSQSCKIAQGQTPQLKLFSFLRRRQQKASHKSLYLECAGRAKRRRRFGFRIRPSFSLNMIQSAVAASLCRHTPNFYRFFVEV